jgi:hypothetical protein
MDLKQMNTELCEAILNSQSTFNKPTQSGLKNQGGGTSRGITNRMASIGKPSG